MEEFDVKRLSEIARELGLEVKKPSSREKTGLYINKENEETEWDAIEELGLKTYEKRYSHYLNKNLFEEETNTISYNYKEEKDEKMSFYSKTSKLSLLSEAA